MRRHRVAAVANRRLTVASRPAITPTDQGKPLPPHAGYVPAETKRVRIGNRKCVEVDGGKWIDLQRDAEFYTRGPKL